MRWTLISFLCILVISNAQGQKHLLSDQIELQSPINIGLEEVNKRFTPPSIEFSELKSGNIGNCNINITYVDFPEEAKVAFEYAISIWEQHINSTVPISILAKWEIMEGNILAQSRPSEFYKNFDAAPISEVYYPIALVEKLSGKEWNNSKEADIICSFNSNISWYFGTDGNTYVTHFDFITAVLHEIAHGLGISGFLYDENGIGKINNPGDNPSIYDYYIYNSRKQRITDNSVINRPSTELHKQLTSNNLDFGYNTSILEVYAPESWKNGVSIYHLSNAQLSTTEDSELMSPYLYKGEANHNPGTSTITVLSEMGWNTNSFQMDGIKDIEETSIELVIQTTLNSPQQLENSSIKIIYTTNNFSTKDSALFSLNQSNQLFEAKLPVNGYTGIVQYYYKAVNTDNETLTFPNQAPNNLLSFKIGTDYYSPQLKHNPSKIVLNSKQEMNFRAIASDNLGIGSVKVEYQINGVAQEVFQLSNSYSDIYTGNLRFPFNINKNDKIEYRIIAEDNSIRKNKKILPALGFYEVEVYETFEPTSGFFSDFNSFSDDFTSTDFDINVPYGFNNATLHTSTPYPTSEIENEKYNIVAHLKHPIILEENGLMTFDEVVLVEPGELDTKFTDEQFWDYVIIEGSKNDGETWHAFVDGYDSGINDNWESRFSETLKSSASSATGHENMFWKQTINLTDNPFFSAGDTVIFRFRLSSDSSINGWGWAIDNLNIQSTSTKNNELNANAGINFYPNPCDNNLFIECGELVNSSSVEIIISDLTGKKVYQETRYAPLYNSKLQIDVTNIKTGIYLASITDSGQNKFIKKIIKN